MAREMVRIDAVPVLLRRIDDIKDTLASIEDSGELVPGETARLKATLAALERLRDLQSGVIAR